MSSIKKIKTTEGDLSFDYNSLDNLPTIPSKTSDITNDSGFITKGVGNLDNYYTKSEVDAKEVTVTLNGSSVSSPSFYAPTTAGTYAGQAAKVGDLFIASATTPTWAYVPSGDDTDVTQVTAGAGLNTTGPDSSTDGGSITTTGTLYLTKTAVTPGSYQGITVDKYGRVTGASDQGYTQKSTHNIVGDGTTTSFTIQHGFETRDIIIQVYDATTYEEVIVDIVRTTALTAAISFAQAPANGKTYRVVCIG